MKLYLKIILLSTFLVSLSWSLEMALTKSGKKVVLKNDGTWEWYNENKHLNVLDIREAEPEISISVKYYDSQYYSDMKKLYWDGIGLSEKELADSINSLPKGGMAHLLINESSINKNDPVMYSFTVKDSKGKVIHKSQSSDGAAFESDKVGIAVLKEIKFNKVVKGNVVIIVKDMVQEQTYQFDLPIK